MRARLLLFAAIALSGCATVPKPQRLSCATSNTGPEADATFAALQKFRPDPKGHHLLISARSEDERGNVVKDLMVWPLSGTQEPAPGQRVRLVLQPCTFKLVRIGALPG